MKYILFIILCLIIYIFFLKRETFANPVNNIRLTNKSQVNNILPHKNEKGNMEYIVTILWNNDLYNPNHIYKITNLKNIGPEETIIKQQHKNKYLPLKNGMIDEKTIIVDINWHRDEEKDGLSIGKKLMCVGLKYNNNEAEYTIYIKKTSDITSEWVVYELNNNPLSNKRIKSIVYDLQDNLLGIDWKENQIYQLNEINSEWVGPISYDKNVKIHKIMFNVEKKMIAIDNYGKLHIKNDVNWRYSNWKSNNKVSKNKIFDMIYDFDGKFIFLVKNKHILKQKNFDIFSLNFVDNFFDNNELTKPVLSFNDIVMYKTGIDSEKYDYLALSDKNKLNNNELKRKTVAMINLNHYLKLKRKLLLKCKNIKNQFSSNKFNIKTDVKSHLPLYQTIDELINKLEQKYE